MKIVADENIPALEPLFAPFADVLERHHGRHLSHADVKDADVLLVRSVTRVNADLLAGSRVKFVGSATIGTDHLDIDWLEQAGIHYTAAPGCNADAVVDYVLTNLLRLQLQQGIELKTRCVGVVGAGNVGGRLVRRLQALGVRVMVCDPPRAEREGGADFSDLQSVFAQADIVCLHTPLVTQGRWPSLHMVGREQLLALKPGAILLNAGRGSVIDENALLSVLDERDDLTVVLDVWEHEPQINQDLLQRVDIGTPHIAGYSLEGKVRGTWMLYQALCQHLQQPVTKTLESLLPPPRIAQVKVAANIKPAEITRLLYEPLEDDRRLRQALQRAGDAQGDAFDRLRRDYPVRREFSSLQVSGDFSEATKNTLRAVGFKVAGGTDDA